MSRGVHRNISSYKATPRGAANKGPQRRAPPRRRSSFFTGNRNRGSITFASDHEYFYIECLDEMSETDFQSIWFTCDECSAMKEEALGYAAAIDAGFGDVDGRGLEEKTSEGRWAAMQARKQGYDIVLGEQERQQRLRKRNAETIATLYIELSALRTAEAIERAKADAMIASGQKANPKKAVVGSDGFLSETSTSSRNIPLDQDLSETSASEAKQHERHESFVSISGFEEFTESSESLLDDLTSLEFAPDGGRQKVGRLSKKNSLKSDGKKKLKIKVKSTHSDDGDSDQMKEKKKKKKEKKEKSESKEKKEKNVKKIKLKLSSKTPSKSSDITDVTESSDATFGSSIPPLSSDKLSKDISKPRRMPRRESMESLSSSSVDTESSDEVEAKKKKIKPSKLKTDKEPKRPSTKRESNSKEKTEKKKESTLPPPLPKRLSSADKDTRQILSLFSRSIPTS